MNKVIEYIISAKDKTGAAISSALTRVKSFAAAAASNLANIKAGFDMLAQVARSFARVFSVAIKEAFKFEKATADFKVLLNSIDAAKEHIADLRRFASSTPLTFDDLAKASKLLLSFGANVQDVMPYLKTLGDISMGNAQKFQGLALVFAQVQSAGKLMGQDLLQMINQGFNPLTIIAQQTGKSVSELKDLMSEGAISFEMVAEAMRVATSEGGLFCGAMDEASQTGEGLMSTLQDKWADAVRTFGNAFTDSAKNGLQFLIDKLTELAEDGSLDRWAQNTARACGQVYEKIQEAVQGFKALGTAVNWLYEKTGVSDVWHGAKSILNGTGAAIGTLSSGGSFSDAAKAYDEAALEEIAQGYYGGKLARAGAFGRDFADLLAQDDATAAAQAAQADAYAVARAKRRAKSVAGGAAPAELEQKASLSQMLDEATEKQRQKEEAAAQKLAEQKAKEAERLAKQEEAERLRIEKAIFSERVKLLQNELNTRKSLQQQAETALAAATAKEAQAWGWYRDKDSLKAQLADERANAEAEIQFQKDFESLKSKHWDWRKAADYGSDSFRALTLDETATKRVALAREEKAAAEEYAKQTAEGVQQMAQTLEALNETVQEGSAE